MRGAWLACVVALVVSPTASAQKRAKPKPAEVKPVDAPPPEPASPAPAEADGGAAAPEVVSPKALGVVESLDLSSGGSEVPVDAADGVSGCRALVQRNELELRRHEAAQPPVKYVHPTRDTTLGATWPEWLEATGRNGALLSATLIPHVNAMLRGAVPEPGLSWPWSFPIGPATSCTRTAGSYTVDRFKPLRVVIEPGFTAGNRFVALFLRPALRFMWHPSGWLLGVGGGLGSFIELTGPEPVRASVSPELAIQLGHCCQPGYVILGVRREIFFAGKTQLWVASVGFTYF